MQHIEPCNDVSPQQARFCTHCGAATQFEARFCAACGTRLLTAADPEGGGESPSVTRLLAAQALLDGGEVAAATPQLEALCSEFPRWSSAWINLAIARLRVGRIHESQDALDAAEALDPGSFACEVAFAEFHARLGFFDRAVTRLDRALALAPPSPRAQTTAIELRRFCQEHAKTIYYRQAAYPRLPFRWRSAQRTAPQSTSTIERNH